MLQRRDKTVFREYGRMIERLWRHLQLRQRCHVLHAQGVRVSVRGWLIVIDGGKRTRAIFPQRLVPKRIHSNNSRRIRNGEGITSRFLRGCRDNPIVPFGEKGIKADAIVFFEALGVLSPRLVHFVQHLHDHA